MYQDYKDLLSAFNAHGVRYLIVGGYAVIFHAQPRFTRDIDLFIKADPENAKATYEALAAFGAPLQSIRVEDLSDPKNFFRFRREPRAIDILPGIDGVDFEGACERRVEGIIDSQSRQKAFFISAADLVAAKIAAGRPQDLADAEALRKAAQATPERKRGSLFE
jgi:Nucleotidyl transferase of unknown function (DUF2204)